METRSITLSEIQTKYPDAIECMAENIREMISVEQSDGGLEDPDPITQDQFDAANADPEANSDLIMARAHELALFETHGRPGKLDDDLDLMALGKLEEHLLEDGNWYLCWVDTDTTWRWTNGYSSIPGYYWNTSDGDRDPGSWSEAWPASLDPHH